MADQPFDPMDVLGNASGAPQAPFKLRTVSSTSDIAPCKFCGGEVKPDAIKCRHCGEFLSEKYASQSRQPAPRGMRNVWIAVGCVLALAATIVAAMYIRDRAENARRIANWENTDNSNEALLASRKFIEEHLMAPATAKHPEPGDAYVTIERLAETPTRYWVRSWVDSHNEFGAMIRKPVSAVVSQKSHDSWELIDLVIAGRVHKTTPIIDPKGKR